MCGINLYLVKKETSEEQILALANRSRHRGPDLTTIKVIHIPETQQKLIMVFHRLAINDLLNGNQPFVDEEQKVFVICNGEIYNWKELAVKYDVTCKSHSDCEIILHLYKKIGFDALIKELDGYFAIGLVDLKLGKVFVGRDYLGVRALYMGINDNEWGFSSEMKSLYSYYTDIQQFPYASHLELDLSSGKYAISKYFSLEVTSAEVVSDEEHILKNVRESFVNAVQKRMMADSPDLIGALLSGGVDSSLLVSVLSRFYSNPKNLHTFSIGLEGAADLKYARIVAEHCGTSHHEYIVNEEELLAEIPNVIRQIESYDVTSVRASTLMFVLCKKIKSDFPWIKVLFSGEVSDEQQGSYLYLAKAKTSEIFQEESLRLVKDLPYFDLLRGDKCTAGNSFEVRLPFADKEFMKNCISISPELKVHQKYGMEKFLLRKAFDIMVDGKYYLPNEVLFRVKAAFSDSRSKKKSMMFYQIIQEHANSLISDEYFEKRHDEITHLKPISKEALWFRDIYESFYVGTETLTPYYWLPKWNDLASNEPSACALGHKDYKFDEE